MITSADNTDFSGLFPEVIIVGGGAVGLLAAAYFASRNVRVLVLEAGPEQLDPASQSILQAAVSCGRKHSGLHQGRFRALGGTTNFWGGQLVRFDKSVFSHRPWIADAAWPLDLKDLQPFYDQCEALLGLPNELRDDEKILSMLDTPPEYRDSDLKYFFTRWLTEKNFRFRFDQVLTKNERVTVVTNAPVTSLKMGSTREEVAAVVIGLSRGTVEVRAPYVVLANGTVEMVRLLQHPTSDGEAAPWAQNRWLGRGFMDHLEGTIANLLPLNHKLFHALFDNIFLQGMKLQPKLRLSGEFQAKEKLLDAAVHIIFESEEHVQNAKIFLSGLLKGRFSNPQDIVSGFWAALRLGLPMAWHYFMNRRIWSPASGDIKLRVVLEHTPLIASQIRLIEKRDKLGMQIAELNWAFASEREIRTIQATANLAKKYLESRGIAKVTIPSEILAGGPNLLDSFVDTFHHMGGVRMAHSESDGFVDPVARVFRCRNLFVMGAAVFPVSGFANPTFTALALALRTAQTIRQELARR